MKALLVLFVAGCGGHPTALAIAPASSSSPATTVTVNRPPSPGSNVRVHVRGAHAKVGEWFSRKSLVDDVMAIQTTYRDAGYGIVDVMPETQLDPKERTVGVKIVIRRGPIVTYHAVHIDPPDALIASDTARRIGVTPGARYSETNLTRVKKELAEKGVRADISTQETRGKPDAVDVTIEVH